MSSNMLMLRWISLNANLGGWGIILLPYWFSLNSSETVKVVTLAFCRIQQHSVKDVRAKFGILHPPRSSDIGQNSDGFFSDFRTSGESLIKKIRNKVKKKLTMSWCQKFWHQCQFSNLRPIWSDPEAGFQTHIL